MSILNNNIIVKALMIPLLALFVGCSDYGIYDDVEILNYNHLQKLDVNHDENYDHQELFETGSPSFTNLRSLIHYNINVSDFEESKAFYEFLGFLVLLEIEVEVSDPDEAQGLNLPPYSLAASPMLVGDGFLIDLIKFYDPFDPEMPNDRIYSLGMSTLSLKTSDLLSDIGLLNSNNIEYSVLVGSENDPITIQLSDPDGTIILLTEVIEEGVQNNFGQTNVYGLLTTNINVSNLNEAIDFYKEIGFRFVSRNKNVAMIALRDGRSYTLTQSLSSDHAYEDVNHLGIARIAIETIDIDQDIKVLQSKGIELYTNVAVVPSGPLSILRYVAFEDPDGTVIELVEYNN